MVIFMDGCHPPLRPMVDLVVSVRLNQSRPLPPELLHALRGCRRSGFAVSADGVMIPGWITKGPYC